jgi:hypothetical protein
MKGLLNMTISQPKIEGTIKLPSESSAGSVRIGYQEFKHEMLIFPNMGLFMKIESLYVVVKMGLVLISPIKYKEFLIAVSVFGFRN